MVVVDVDLVSVKNVRAGLACLSESSRKVRLD